MEFLIRLARVLVGIILISTLIFTVIPSMILWIFIGRNFLMDVAEWVAVGEYP